MLANVFLFCIAYTCHVKLNKNNTYTKTGDLHDSSPCCCDFLKASFSFLIECSFSFSSVVILWILRRSEQSDMKQNNPVSSC